MFHYLAGCLLRLSPRSPALIIQATLRFFERRHRVMLVCFAFRLQFGPIYGATTPSVRRRQPIFVPRGFRRWLSSMNCGSETSGPSTGKRHVTNGWR